MPKDNFVSLTVSEDFVERLDEVTKNENSSRQEFLTGALKEYLPDSMQPHVTIAGKNIGSGSPVYVIAEIGINHNGSIEMTKKMIDMAAECGCHAVKFQKRTITSVYSPEELAKPREIPTDVLRSAIERRALPKEREELLKGFLVKNLIPSEVPTTNGDQKYALEFGEDDYKEIGRYCQEKGIIWFASPWDLDSIDFLEKLDVPCYKIASASLTDKKFLNKIKDTGKPIILSTGMSTMEQVKKAVDILGEENLILLHCTSTYPTPEDEQDLNVIKTLKKVFNCPVGYSGHEAGIQPTLTAIALGACVVERHITLDRSMYGSDQRVSLEKDGLHRICRGAEKIPLYLGKSKKIVQNSEVPVKASLRKITDF
jgi:N-acetylneuraminate synthase